MRVYSSMSENWVEILYNFEAFMHLPIVAMLINNHV